MARSFQLDRSATDPSELGLMLALLCLALFFSVVDLWVRFAWLRVSFGPIIVFVVTRLAYQRRCRKLLAAQRSATEPDTFSSYPTSG